MSKIALQLDSVNAFKNNMFNAMASVYRDRGLQGFNVGYLGVDVCIFSRIYFQIPYVPKKSFVPLSCATLCCHADYRMYI